MNDQRRLLLAVVLSAAVLFAWQKFYGPPQKPVHHLADGGVALVVDGGARAAEPDAGPAPVVAINPPPVLAPNAVRPPEEKVVFDSAKRTFTFSSYGGTLSSAVLKGEQFQKKVDGKDRQVDLVDVRAGQPLPFSISLEQGFPTVAANLPYQVEKTADGVIFRAQVQGLELSKRYTVPKDGYDVALEVTVKNTGAAAASGELSMDVGTFIPPGSEEHSGWMPSFLFRGPSEERLPIGRVAEDVKRQSKDKDGIPEKLTGAIGYVGLDEHYFLAAAYPVAQKDGSVQLSVAADGIRRADMSFAAKLGAGETLTRTFGLYLGPKLDEALAHAGTEIPALAAAKPDLKTVMEYGWFEVVSIGLLWVLRFLYDVIPNWGIAILLLTLAVKLVTLPLTMKQMKSMEAMKRLQPQIDAMKAKFKGDKERQNVEMMKLYQQNKVNPMSGCLPMLIQMPIFIGLYRTLEYAFDLYRQPFIPGWITDLSAIDHTYVLAGLLVVTMFVSQRMQPQMGDATQAKLMMYGMPIMFSLMMISLPSGLSLYYVFNNILSIGQQMWLRRKFPGSVPAAKPA